MLAHVLESLPFFLHRVVASARSVYLQSLALYLYGLTFSLTFYQFSYHIEARTRGDVLQSFGIELRRIDHNLYVLYRRSVVQCNEIYGFTAAMCTYPALYVYVIPKSVLRRTSTIFVLFILEIYLKATCKDAKDSTSFLHLYTLLYIYIYYVIRKRPCEACRLPSL